MSASSELALRPDFSGNLERPRHRWFDFKEGFDADVVRHVIAGAACEPGIVVDPFSGSGTTLIEAAALGWDARGMEVNPFLAFVARAKAVSGIRPERLLSLAARVHRARVDGPPLLPRGSTLVQRAGLKKWLFNTSVARRFESLRAAIHQEAQGKYRLVLRLALISAMGDVANARRDGKCWRYKREWQARAYSSQDLDIAFRTTVDDYAQDLCLRDSLSGRVRVHEGDARTPGMWRHVPSGVAAVVTSPPYLNSFDYTDIYRPEMMLMGGYKTSGDLRRIRFRTVRSHVQVEWPTPRPSQIRVARVAVRRLGTAVLWNRRLGEMVNAYFVDLEDVLGRAVQRLRAGGVLGVVVADSAYAGHVIRVGTGVAEIVERHGATLEDIRVLRRLRGNGHHQRRGGSALREELVLARKDGG